MNTLGTAVPLFIVVLALQTTSVNSKTMRIRRTGPWISNSRFYEKTNEFPSEHKEERDLITDESRQLLDIRNEKTSLDRGSEQMSNSSPNKNSGWEFENSIAGYDFPKQFHTEEAKLIYSRIWIRIFVEAFQRVTSNLIDKVQGMDQAELSRLMLQKYNVQSRLFFTDLKKLYEDPTQLTGSKNDTDNFMIPKDNSDNTHKRGIMMFYKHLFAGFFWRIAKDIIDAVDDPNRAELILSVSSIFREQLQVFIDDSTKSIGEQEKRFKERI